MSTHVMAICKYNNLSFVVNLAQSSPLEVLMRMIKDRWPDIPQNMFLSYSLPNNAYCDLSSQDDYTHMFIMIETINLKYVEITLGPRLPVIVPDISETTSACGCSSVGLPSAEVGEQEIVDYIPIRMSERWKDCITGLNQVFLDGASQFRIQLKKYSIYHGFEYHYIRNTKLRVTACCKQKESVGCEWFIHAKADNSDKVLYVTKYIGLHTCGVGHLTRNSSRIGSDIVADVVLEKMRLRPMYRACDAVTDFSSEYGFDISYDNAWKGVQKARESIYGEYRLSYDLLFKYTNAARVCNPGSHILFESDPETKRFIRLFIAFNACIQGFNFCRPILFLDGTFLTGRYRGQMLCVTAKDGNNHLFPVSYAIVDSENTENWSWVMQQLLVVLDGNGNQREITFVSDRNQGILNAVSTYFPSSPHGYCTYHLKTNLRTLMGAKPTNLKESIIKMFDKVIYARTEAHFATNLEAMINSGGSKVAGFLESISPEHYAHAYFRGLRYGEVTSNAAESLNKKFVDERQLPIIGLVDGIRKEIMKDMSDKRDMSASWRFTICPVYDSILINRIEVGKLWTVLKSSDNVYEVRAKKSVSVNFSTRTCSCHSWQIYHFPCAHAVAAILYSKLPLDSFIDPCFYTETFRKTYQLSIFPVPTIHMERTTSPNIQVLPPISKPQPGRPKKKRMRSAGEVRKQSRCKLCRKFGHNRRTCSVDND